MREATDAFISARKYRDERRPRQGLLRSREFIMKDLYTFDYSEHLALQTYHEVREVYTGLFDELKIPYLVADADSGNMGGNLSHEFHFPTPQGEDHVISCNECGYVANEELAECSTDITVDPKESSKRPHQVWSGLSKDRRTLINVWYPSNASTCTETDSSSEDINIHAIKAIVPELDASIEDPRALWERHWLKFTEDSSTPTESERPHILNIFDFRVSEEFKTKLASEGKRYLAEELGEIQVDIDLKDQHLNAATHKPLNLLRIRDGDNCSRCSTGKLNIQKAIELGHTFFLGTRYSEPLQALIAVPDHLLSDEKTPTNSKSVPLQMGCHGIGVSRIIGAVADTLADEKGLNWPRVMAPFEVVVIPTGGMERTAEDIYDALSLPNELPLAPLDLVLDDRAGLSFPWKVGDADLIGYPIIVIVGKKWKKEKLCDVQCRRLGISQGVSLQDLPAFIRSLLDQL